MYTDLYLKFDSEEQATAVLYTEVPVEWNNEDPENPVVTQTELRPNFTNIDTIGTIYEGGEWDAEGNVITKPTALEGHHVNVRLLATEDDSSLEQYKIEVNSPMRVWA